MLYNHVYLYSAQNKIKEANFVVQNKISQLVNDYFI